jgi:hypothetical protein
MTLKDKFQQWFINDEEDEHYEGMVELVSIEHEKIADEHAIGFAEWSIKWRVEFVDDTQEGVLYTYGGLYQKFTMKQLLEIYKKETGL